MSRLTRIIEGASRMVFGQSFIVGKGVPATMAEIDLTWAKGLVPSLQDANANRPYIEGDHLQGGDAWVGPGPRRTDPRYADFLDILSESFVSKNVIDEGCERLSGAVIGWEPRWAWVPQRQDLEETPQTDDETALIHEIESALTLWWDNMQVHKLLKRMLYRMLWAAQDGWRVYVPAGLTDDAGRLNVSSLGDALAKIYIDIPEPEDIAVWVHPDTKKKVGIVLYQDSKGAERAEICYLDEMDRTVVRLLPDKDNASTSQAANDFGGHLTIYVISMDKPLITEQVRSLQDAYNMTLTLLEKGLVDNHFLERFFGNTMPPGHWEYEEDGKTRKRFVPDTRTTGGRTDSYMMGVDYLDKDGNTVMKDPSITIRNPLDPNGTIGGAEYWYQAILEEIRQDHVLINQLATPSGKSRDHSKGDFIDSTKDPIIQMNLAGQELLWTIVHMAEAFTNKPGRWTKKLKPIFKCRPNYGPLSVAERQQNIVEAEKGFLSDETVIALNGTDDVDAEQSLIMSQPRAMLALSGLRADAVNKWALDFPREVALHLAGFTDKEITAIMGRVTRANSLDPLEEPPVPVPGNGPPTPPGPRPGGRGPTVPIASRTIPPAGNRPSTAARDAAIR